jgi:conjugal transfer pilus assembly protein TraV
MTRVPFPSALAALAVALAVALSGCATTGTSGPDSTAAPAADAQSSAIVGTRVVSVGAALPRPEDPAALRVPARVMRIWIAPWEDSRGDLHAPGYLYTEIEPRRWALERPRGVERATRIRPLQIERREAPADTRPPGRDTGATRTPGRTKGPESGPGLLGS